MAKLKPCPFCGGEARCSYRRPFNIVVCKKCGSHGKMVADCYEQQDGKDEAIKSWNRRAEDGT